MPLDPGYDGLLKATSGLTWDMLLAEGFSLEEWNGTPALRAPHHPDVTAEDLPSVGRPFSARCYRPASGVQNGKGLVWVHGGGFTSGDLDMPEADAVAQALVSLTGCAVVSVGYRLAGRGVSFPAPLDDVVDAFLWAQQLGTALGVSAGEWRLGGASAGGCLALSAAQRLRDADGPTPAALLLAYPMVHATLPPASPELEKCCAVLPEILRFPQHIVEGMWNAYLGDEAGGGGVPPYAIPALGSLSGLPPTLVLVSEYDDLRPSGEALHMGLLDSGGSSVLRLEEGALHGHLNMPCVAPTLRSLDAMSAWLS